MKCGGNTSFADWLVKHRESSRDLKEKYSSKAAQSYKEELIRRTQRDEATFGNGKVVIDSAAAAAALAQATKQPDDFFETWDNTKVTLTKPLIPQANLMSFGLSPSTTPLSATPTASPRSDSPPVTVAPTASRTVTSSSLRTATTTTTAGVRSKPSLGTRISSTSSSTGGSSTARGKLGGVKKGGPAVNFEEAERKAKEEEERIQRLGYDSRLEAENATVATSSSSPSSSSSYRSPNQTNGNTTTVSTPSSDLRKNLVQKPSGETERLGMGSKRLGFGQVIGMSGSDSAREQAIKEKAATRKANGYGDEPGTFLSTDLSFPSLVSHLTTTSDSCRKDGLRS